MVAPLALVPALAVNVDWTGASGWGWAAGSAASIFFSAVFFVASRFTTDWTSRANYMGWGCFLILVNAVIAFDNASHRSDHRSDYRKTAMVAAKTQSSQRSQWSQGRFEAATVAGEKAPATYQAEIDAKVATDSRRWQSTGECNPLQITAGPSRDFCSEVADLKAKKAAAERRDELDISVVMAFGVEVPDAARRALVTLKDVLRSIMLEVVAALGPAAWLLVVDGLIAGAQRPPVPARPVKRDTPEATARHRLACPDAGPTGAVTIRCARRSVPPLRGGMHRRCIGTHDASR